MRLAHLAWRLRPLANSAVAPWIRCSARVIPKKIPFHSWPIFILFSGYPRNPFNDVICCDTISASGVFTAKELCRLSRGKSYLVTLFGWKALIVAFFDNLLQHPLCRDRLACMVTLPQWQQRPVTPRASMGSN